MLSLIWQRKKIEKKRNEKIKLISLSRSLSFSRTPSLKQRNLIHEENGKSSFDERRILMLKCQIYQLEKQVSKPLNIEKTTKQHTYIY